ncbi:branched-chain amino acid ABC transporter permease, partial [Bradyrhizobium sp.]|uniref:branched-chain amino acid ABC transporter permease n=1 Tax=Bradyrhizobium sp. TaxID=376 RepID=UPI003C661154
MKMHVGEWLLFVVLFGLGIAIALLGTGYQAQTLFQMAMMTLLAIGWNVISGFTGYVSFGQVSFFGLGAYVAAIIFLQFDAPWYVAAIVSAIGATVLALPLGMIMLRLNGIFFALGMFGLARILQLIANSLDITGGPMGTSVPVADSPQISALVAVVAVAAGVLVSHLLSRSRLGMTLMATRDDPVAAEAAGVNTW